MNVHRTVLGKSPPFPPDKHFDVKLHAFYKRVVQREMDVDGPDFAQRVRRALKEVVGAYKKQTVESLTSHILFDSPEERCAYVLKHCACFTSALARHFRKFLIRSLATVFQRQLRLNLCCVGGGPATDAVAVAKVVDDWTTSTSSALFEGARVTLGITVLDLSDRWRSTAESVVQELERECSGRLRFSLEFLQVDLTDHPWPTPVVEALATADVVTMSYFVSAVNGSQKAALCESMLERIVRTCKPGGALFFLDSSKDVHFDALARAAHSEGCLERAYGPRVNEFHSLSMDSVREFVRLYRGLFAASACLTDCFVTCAAWLKRGRRVCRRLPCDACGAGLATPASNAARKRFAYGTVRQAAFRQRLERTFFRSASGFEGVGDSEEEDDWGEPDHHRLEWRLLERLDSSRRRRAVKLRGQHRRTVLVRTADDCEGGVRRGDASVRLELGDWDEVDRCCGEKISSVTKWTRKKAVKEVRL